jgi:hypothetical protein
MTLLASRLSSKLVGRSRLVESLVEPDGVLIGHDLVGVAVNRQDRRRSERTCSSGEILRATSRQSGRPPIQATA